MIVSKLFEATWFVLSWIMLGLVFVYGYLEWITLSVLSAFQSIYRR